jgi:hypothetical protein
MGNYNFGQDKVSARPANVRVTSLGFLVLGESDNSGLGFIVGLYLLTSFLVILKFVFLVEDSLVDSLLGICFLVIGIQLLITLIIVPFFIFSQDIRNQTLASFLLSPEEVILSDYPLRLGQKYTLNFDRFIKTGIKTTSVGTLTFRIACLERTLSGSGSNIHASVNVIWQSQPQMYFVSQNVDTVSFKTNFTLPKTQGLKKLPTSFEAENNQIRWVISIEQTIPGIVKEFHSNFVVDVQPSV